ncbi:MAG: hypothetical protein M3275_10380 [Thermoproteota archaeon]|nr:hypothetical protein [Thermoproteota archaeon]
MEKHHNQAGVRCDSITEVKSTA